MRTLIIVIAVIVSLLCGGLAYAQADPPNIVFVVADDMDLALGEQMPNITSLIRDRGMEFTRAYNSYPLCCPARTTFLTGEYGHNHGVKENKDGYSKFKNMGHDKDNIAVDLDNAGYRTALYGKYLNGYSSVSAPPPGWDEWGVVMDDTSGGSQYYNYKLNDNGHAVQYGNDESDYQTDVLSGKAQSFIQTSGEDPFFLFMAPQGPHEPSTPPVRYDGIPRQYTPPPNFDEEDVSDKTAWVRNKGRLSSSDVQNVHDKYEKRYNTMLGVDDMVGDLVATLTATGELDNTYIMFVADNGWHQGEHRIKSGKRTFYEESAHTPLYVAGPGITPGSVSDKLVSNVDFAITFADMAGTVRSGDGRSIVPLLHQQQVAWRNYLLLEGFGGGPPGYSGVVSFDGYKAAKYNGGGTEFYNLNADPYELNSLPNDSTFNRLDEKRLLLENCVGVACKIAEE